MPEVSCSSAVTEEKKTCTNGEHGTGTYCFPVLLPWQNTGICLPEDGSPLEYKHGLATPPGCTPLLAKGSRESFTYTKHTLKGVARYGLVFFTEITVCETSEFFQECLPHRNEATHTESRVGRRPEAASLISVINHRQECGPPLSWGAALHFVPSILWFCMRVYVVKLKCRGLKKHLKTLTECFALTLPVYTQFLSFF